MTKHKIIGIEATHGTIVIGCECGWAHAELKGFDAAAARKRVRKVYAEHKAAAAKCRECGGIDPDAEHVFRFGGTVRQARAAHA